MVFQDPYSSLNPRLSVGSTIAEGIKIHRLARGAEVKERVAGCSDKVGLPASAASKYPHEFSGGQRQRIGIARALAVEPDMLVADEPVSALDVSVRAQIINLLKDLQRDMGLTYLFIAHDLGIVEHMSDAVAVMYCGKIVERAPTRDLFREPLHPYTQGLIASVPVADPSGARVRAAIPGDVPSPVNIPSRLRLQPALPARDGHMPRRKARSRRGRSRARGALLAPSSARRASLNGRARRSAAESTAFHLTRGDSCSKFIRFSEQIMLIPYIRS